MYSSTEFYTKSGPGWCFKLHQTQIWIYEEFDTDSGFLTKTLVRPIWYWSLSMLTERRRWRTPCCSGPLQHGHVSAVRMAYLDNPHPSPKTVNLAVNTQWIMELSKNEAGLHSPHQKLAEDSAVCKSCPSYSDVFPQSQIFNLMFGSGTAAFT